MSKLTAKQEADELFGDMFSFVSLKEGIEHAKISAKFCAIAAAKKIWSNIDENFIADFNSPALSERRWNNLNDHWKSVIEELNKI